MHASRLPLMVRPYYYNKTGSSPAADGNTNSSEDTKSQGSIIMPLYDYYYGQLLKSFMLHRNQFIYECGSNHTKMILFLTSWTGSIYLLS